MVLSCSSRFITILSPCIFTVLNWSPDLELPFRHRITLLATLFQFWELSRSTPVTRSHLFHVVMQVNAPEFLLSCNCPKVLSHNGKALCWWCGHLGRAESGTWTPESQIWVANSGILPDTVEPSPSMNVNLATLSDFRNADAQCNGCWSSKWIGRNDREGDLHGCHSSGDRNRGLMEDVDAYLYHQCLDIPNDLESRNGRLYGHRAEQPCQLDHVRGLYYLEHYDSKLIPSLGSSEILCTAKSRPELYLTSSKTPPAYLKEKKNRNSSVPTGTITFIVCIINCGKRKVAPL